MNRIAISEITTAEWTFEEDVAAYAETDGVDGIGVWRDKIEDIELEEAAATIEESGLDVASLIFTGGFTEDFDAAVADGKEALREADRLDAPVLLVLGGPRVGIDAAEGNRYVRRALEELAPIAEETGVTLALEPIHPMQVTVFSTVVTLDQARELVADVQNTGIMFDTWNSWWEPDIEASIDCAGDEITAVHVADWRHSTDDPSDRAPPDEGVAPLRDLLSAVENTGYNSWYEVELFTDQYAPEEYEELLERCVEGTQRVLPE